MNAKLESARRDYASATRRLNEAMLRHVASYRPDTNADVIRALADQDDAFNAMSRSVGYPRD